MTTIVNTDKLNLKLTSYGLERIAEAMSNPSVTLNVSKIKVGDANGNYYVPTAEMEDLVHPIPNGSFYVIRKELLEDEVTVCFQTYIPETFGNCDIREVGLYETVGETDKLFAICTQQPIVKPDNSYNYFIAIDYYIFLKSVNLANVYDQIILNPDNKIITEEDLQEFMSSMLFTQGNLSYQIGNNTHVIGLDRPTQLYEQITQMRDTIGYSAIASNFATFSELTGSSNVLGYWVFNYPKKNLSAYSIADLSPQENNFSTNQSINSFEKEVQGIISTLKVPAPYFYYLNTEAPLNLYNVEAEEDYSFTMMFLVKPLDTSVTRTLLAKSNYATNSHSFEVNELNTGAVEVKLFTDEGNCMVFTSATNLINEEPHVLTISYDANTMSLIGYLNEKFLSFSKSMSPLNSVYTHMSLGNAQLYGYSFSPYEIVYTNSPTLPTTLYNRDGSPCINSHWGITNESIYYDAIQAEYTEGLNVSTDTLYCWTYDDGVHTYSVYTKTLTITENTVLYNENYTEYTGDKFSIQYVDSTYVIQYESYFTSYTPELNKEPVFLYAFRANLPEIHIWANSSSTPTILFTQEGDTYLGEEWTIENYEVHYKDEGIATYDSSYDFVISTIDATSYITDSAGKQVQYVNSEVGVVAVAKAGLSTEEIRICTLELMTALGYSPCITING